MEIKCKECGSTDLKGLSTWASTSIEFDIKPTPPGECIVADSLRAEEIKPSRHVRFYCNNCKKEIYASEILLDGKDMDMDSCEFELGTVKINAAGSAKLSLVLFTEEEIKKKKERELNHDDDYEEEQKGFLVELLFGYYDTIRWYNDDLPPYDDLNKLKEAFLKEAAEGEEARAKLFKNGADNIPRYYPVGASQEQKEKLNKYYDRYALLKAKVYLWFLLTEDEMKKLSREVVDLIKEHWPELRDKVFPENMRASELLSWLQD
ncbi:hypothetical protein COY52_05595 [Candidatus Desantisbacteria bacterium CG_4_10_14_0_8_um_filter_48_22]|uniref:CpXC domain-containing protein n=1 Tax=Candidatus Desantisbacteria bacterium CG_4_10_14_0_8_um_filter_48_22 TaxID=1974543 RepID=A0A2M7SBX3_9BACT|nr:MAG: hypothetical protein AUJ67_10520 [Candidatus Desantisbacteria bacterium CG1_02_49_89]PIV56018.1 MAG: hypothetical protein COS16_05260 [Candidatus Desantisbacteria bacterium CG02_land_8_20_14_3_00_49_13]PIZ16974.1 MAG: hypothetical protein COY52_05595 [Candidatus Desantisbacteria bacterium CG_4_10_14_0_8_um_filter_48_22]PJB27819.1 MAG: hypothetical protein CO111_03280 [Candidatus Desantisbacteria bacterium CG_4_9_14_3_um_filter_50_7]